jgi:hypothetical protein
MIRLTSYMSCPKCGYGIQGNARTTDEEFIDVMNSLHIGEDSD